MTNIDQQQQLEEEVDPMGENTASPGPSAVVGANSASCDKLLEVSPESMVKATTVRDMEEDEEDGDDEADDASAVNWNWGNDDGDDDEDNNSIGSHVVKTGGRFTFSANATGESDDDATVVLSQEIAEGDAEEEDDITTMEDQADPAVVNDNATPPRNPIASRTNTIREVVVGDDQALRNASATPQNQEQGEKEEADFDKEKKLSGATPSVQEQTPLPALLTFPPTPSGDAHSAPQQQTTQPDTDRLVASTDRLFLQADKDKVSVVDIVRALEAELGMTFTKATKNLVKGHLIGLLTDQVQPQVVAAKPSPVKDLSKESEMELATSKSPTKHKKGEVSSDNMDNGRPRPGAEDGENESDDDGFPHNEDEGWETQMPGTTMDSGNVLDTSASGKTEKHGKEELVAKASLLESDSEDEEDKNAWETQAPNVINPRKSSKPARAETDEIDKASDDELFDAPEDHDGEEKAESRTETPTAMEDVGQDDQNDKEDTKAETTIAKESLAAQSSSPSKTAADPTNNPPATASGRVTRRVAAKSQPSLDDLITSTDYLFLQADKDSVTVKDIVLALEAEFDLELTKQSRKFVRNHLTGLITGTIESSVQQEEGDHQSEDGSSDKEGISDQGDSESEASDYEEEAKTSKKKTSSRGNRVSKGKRRASKAPKSETSSVQKPNQRAAAKAARLVQVERLRKRRIEELRVRNEEMQLNQSKEDQERAEKIAAKFETNTEELRVQRLEDRLDLLKRLDQKRINVIELDKEDDKKIAAKDKGNLEESVKAEPHAESPDDESEDESDSSDDEELVIVGVDKPLKPLPRLHNQNQKSKLALSILGGGAKVTSLKKPKVDKPLMTSPNKSRGAREALRNVLRRKQRQVGNRWLARELGYKDESEHLKDCLTLATKKRDIVVKMEQDRLKANELKHERERLRIQDPNAEPESDAEEEAEFDENAPVPARETNDEDDEELELAREIEQEGESVSSPSKPTGGEQLGEQEETEEIINESEKAGVTEAQSDGDVPSSDNPTAEEPSDDFGNFEADEDEPLSLETQPVVSQTDDAGQTDDLTTTKGLARVVSKDNSQSSPQSGDGIAEESTEKTAVSSNGIEASDDGAKVGSKTVANDEDEKELEDTASTADKRERQEKQNKPRNAGWQAMLQREAEKLKKQRKVGNGLIEAEAEEEEEEEVAGLEDFGFKVHKKKGEDDDDENIDDKLDEEDLKHVVDDVSDDEGDEDAGDAARKRQDQREEKDRHKEIMRRLREGYDGRRGGIASGGTGARGMHRFDQLVAADNRADAERLGLLNDDELDSDNEDKGDSQVPDDEEDEAALLDKMLKDRFLHRSNVDLEENFSDDEDQEDGDQQETGTDEVDEEERTQERLAKRFAKRARMQRLVEEHGETQEFSQQRLLDEDESMKLELSRMKNGLVRKRSVSSASRSSISSTTDSGSQNKRQRSTGSFGGSFLNKGASLSLALQASRQTKKHRTSFLGGMKVGASKDVGGLVHKSIALSHVVFRACDSQFSNRSNLSNTSFGGASSTGKRKTPGSGASGLWGKVVGKAKKLTG